MHTTIKNKNSWIITSNKDFKEIDDQWFTQDYWMNQGRLLGANSGRGSTWVVKSEWGKWVLRHYFRGGLYAKLSRDSYFWTGLNNTRAYQEFKLLAHMQQLDLPCPKPIAALVSKKGLFYRNDIIMSHIQHDHTFATGLSDNNLSTSTWAKIGQTIAQFHQHGIYHSDLNAHNILINDATGEVFIIDFDKGKVKSLQKSWRQENLNRLKRSIEKITGLSCNTDLTAPWQALLDAYLAEYS